MLDGEEETTPAQQHQSAAAVPAGMVQYKALLGGGVIQIRKGPTLAGKDREIVGNLALGEVVNTCETKYVTETKKRSSTRRSGRTMVRKIKSLALKLADGACLSANVGPAHIRCQAHNYIC